MRVIPIAHTPFNIVKSYLLVGERVVVVDTGPPGGERRVLNALHRHGIDRRRVSLIVATHAHPDHVGGAAALRAQTGAPIAIDDLERDFVQGNAKPVLRPTGIAGWLFQFTPLPHEQYTRFTAEIVIRDGLRLDEFGVDAHLIQCGGHTPGSLSVHVPATGDLIMADLLAGGIGIGGLCFQRRVIEPPFHVDRAQVRRVVSGLMQLPQVKTIHVCHGGPLRPDGVLRWLQRVHGTSTTKGIRDE